MKFKATKKEMKANYRNILSVGYCDLQQLLKYESPIAYSAGTYGWCCDYYDIDGVIISTGYSPIGKDTDYKTIRKYEKLAHDLPYTPEGNAAEYKKLILTMLEELKEVLKPC